MTVKLAFIHIPKTGGVSVLHSLQQAFGKDSVFTVRPDAKADIHPDQFPTVEIPAGTSVVAGHITCAQLWKNPTIQFAKPVIFSVIRDPFERLLSLFNYNHATGRYSEPMRNLAGLEKVIEKSPPNRQCEFLERPGVSAERIAQKNYVYALPNVDSAVRGLFSSFGVTPPDLKRLNVTKDRNAWRLHHSDVPESLKKRAYTLNSRDADLYESLLGKNERQRKPQRRPVG